MEFPFLTPPPHHFGWIVFAFLALYRPTDYVYKIWFSLVQGQEFSFFDPPLRFGWLVFAFLALGNLGKTMINLIKLENKENIVLL